jgi:hypothetical protein
MQSASGFIARLDISSLDSILGIIVIDVGFTIDSIIDGRQIHLASMLDGRQNHLDSIIPSPSQIRYFATK